MPASDTAPKAARPIRLYRHPLSGHAHRVELMLSLLGLPVERIDVDLMAGEHKRSEFLAKNPFGQVPVIEDGDLTLADSNAILVYLALAYDPSRRWLPADPATAGEVQRWLSVAAGPLVQGPSTARLIRLFGYDADHARAVATAEALLARLDRHLAGRSFLVGDAATIADLALYAYTVLAPEGGVALDPYPAVAAWLGRVEALPGFVPVNRTTPPSAA
jgi:glutathione S-transferase